MSLKKKIYRVAGLGEVLWDVFPEGKRLGGAPANFAAHAQQLGAHAFVLSAVGKDALGREALVKLDQYGIDLTGLLEIASFPTGTVSVDLDQHGNPSYEIQENVAWDHTPLQPSITNTAKHLDAVCFGTLAQRNKTSQNTIFKTLRATSDNCLKVFDLNFRKNYYHKEMLLQSFDISDVVKMNEEEFVEIQTLFSLPSNLQKGMMSLMERFDLKLAMLTLGRKGSIMMSQNDYSELKVNQSVQVKSTVGAGDAFTAAAVMGWLNQKPLDKIHHKSSDLAAYVCSQLDAVPKISNHS
ncbi:MAG: PfkB family carbohydrate kinase [Bacteroidetes bacterium]|nr:PfkB family carbohydrate kinase [Bacteroidota bacterium]MDA0936289.1 PfkB family carbohydrate kinase [Bacteroidota bacterium]